MKEFEQILNSSRYMINNLDLNRDGWIDYLRVIETARGYYHAMLIQACLAPGVFQDVATLVAERRPDVLYVEVIGDPYLYGYNYIVRPVFVKRPPMWDVYGHPSYSPWSSPYYYSYYPSYYTQPKPVYLNHYQAYVNTYMTNHHYCHHCDYPTTVFYTGYTSMTQPNSRNDYATQHPSDSFERRVTRTASSTNGVSVRNAGQLRSEVNKTAAKTETKEEKPATSTRSTSTTTTTATTTKTGTSTRSTTTTTKPAATKPAVNSTTVESRVNKSGTTRTTVKTTDATGRTSTVKRETSTRSTGSSTRSTSTSTGTSTRSSQGSSSESTPRSTQRGR